MKIRNAQIKIIFISLNLFVLTFSLSFSSVNAQDVVDKTVATIGDGAGDPELITYSDLLWQLALQPGVPLNP
ncbi:MAG: hypothetical protein M3367_00920, partial [Acidobacteriota bacterium]|nr:hypothetical protein [Acidobacteriota bacterium]